MVADESFEQFKASMPTSYREAFRDEDASSHAAVVGRRSGSATRVEIWKELPERVVAICIVADDRPGLLSQISAALLANEIDVVTAHAYCRTRSDGATEAVDLLWIRHVAGETILAKDVARIGEMVDALVRGNAKFDTAVKLGRAIRSSAESTRVRFESGAGDVVLTVEATDRPGLLLVVTKAIFRAKLQIIGLRATSEQGRAMDRFHLAELDGRPLVQGRLLALQSEIFAALEDGEGDEREGAAAG